MQIEYFGVKLLKRKKSFKLVREEFALIDTKPSFPFVHRFAEDNAYEDEQGRKYRKEWCQKYRELCLKNYDLNMKYFASLNKEEFDKEVNEFLSVYKEFEEIQDLNKCAGVEGYYLLILDEYKQGYIGKSCDIKRRIMQHWANVKSFDRVLLPFYGAETSCFSIDFFRAFDTTRIYIWKKEIKEGIEMELVENFPKRFQLNRIGGDVTSLLKAVTTLNRRNFNESL